MCIYCKERCFLFSDIILINSNPNNKHLQNRNFVYIIEREVVQNVKITCAASDIDLKCIWSISTTKRFSKLFWIVVVLSGFLGASILINSSFQEWNESPIKTIIETFSIGGYWTKYPKVVTVKNQLK